MRVRRLLAAVVTTGLIAPTAVIVASTAPASAATATSIVSGSQGRGWIKVNDYSSQAGAPVAGTDQVSFSINVKGADGKQVYDGSLVVQQLAAGSRSWQTIATSSSAYLYKSVDIKISAQYRVFYSGTAEYAPTGASVGTVKAQRKLTINGMSGKRAGFKGKVAPKAKIKIIVQKKVGKKFKKYKTVRSNRKGRFTVVLPAPSRGKFVWKITFKGSKGYTSSVIKGSTYRR
ncbi:MULTISPECIES: hypothetical protein [unclassified Nocardioides]|uniref:hypothetical protein n=1 Tax=unclassified Nocardioides TaxID=2615069 RepID=UPI0030156643